MKKITGFVLTLILCMGLTAPALADSFEWDNELVLEQPAHSVWVSAEKEISTLEAYSWPGTYHDGSSINGWTYVASGSEFTVTNNSTDGESYGYVYYQEFRLMPEGSTGFFSEDWFTDRKEIDLSGRYVAYNVWNLSTEPSGIGTLSAGNGLYWRQSAGEGTNAADERGSGADGVKLLYAGESVTFQLPRVADGNSVFRIFTEAYDPSTGLHDAFCYDFKVGTPAVPTFTDLDGRAQWAKDSIYAAAGAGLVLGANDRFAPTDELSWAQALAFAVRLDQYRLKTHVYGQADQGSPWYQIYVDYALANGLIDQAPAAPNAIIDRSDALNIFAKVLDWSAPEVNDVPEGYFTDLTPDHPVYDAAYRLARAGITNGIGGGKFGPDAKLTREQVSALVARIAGLVEPARLTK